MQIRSFRGSGEPVWVNALSSACERLGPDPRRALGPAATPAASTGRTRDRTRPMLQNVRKFLPGRRPHVTQTAVSTCLRATELVSIAVHFVTRSQQQATNCNCACRSPHLRQSTLSPFRQVIAGVAAPRRGNDEFWGQHQASQRRYQCAGGSRDKPGKIFGPLAQG
jgi:hypothetical protein